MKKVILLLIGLTSFCVALTVLFLSMRAVLGVGGFCAEGGAYVIKTHCPGGTAYLTPLSIFAMLIGGALYFIFSNKTPNSPKWGTFFWSALFVSLGWNFLDFAVHPIEGTEIEYSLLFCGIMFVLMGIVPLLFPRFLVEIFYSNSSNSLTTILFGQSIPTTTITKWYESRFFLLFMHFAAVALGIYAGMRIFFSS